MFMELFRIASQKFASELKASGAQNRWNLFGQKVIYTAASRSLATLELFVSRGGLRREDDFKMMIINVPDDDRLFRQIFIKELPVNWRETVAYSRLQAIGSNWYKNKETLVLKIPSSVIPQEYNYVINTEHPLFATHVKLIRQESFYFDSRLQR